MQLVWNTQAINRAGHSAASANAVADMPQVGPPFKQHLPDRVDVVRFSIQIAKKEAGVRRESLEFAAGNVDERVGAGGGTCGISVYYNAPRITTC